ncbi:MAG: phosphoribosylamine--glycine ligase [Vampirovibrionales bacterium]|nr:phosphoribosylamine--glycine ligase [Vampirovibrionales bacterium]
MKILVVGSGGREHALGWRLSQDVGAPNATPYQLFFAPGNPGMAALGQCLDIEATNIFALSLFAEKEKIDLVVVGPEAPLAAGLADALQAKGIAVFGPVQAGAQVEASKAFAKTLMMEARVPTAAYQQFKNPLEAIEALDKFSLPYVIKEDGLAAGKGVTVTESKATAVAALKHAAAKGASVVVEDFLVGGEVSVLAMCDGTRAIPMLPARDYKRAYDCNQGPNTGGMGSIAPVPNLPCTFLKQVQEQVLAPMMRAFRARGIDYRGVLYAGLMVQDNGDINVVEFNARFGDPETQVVLPLLNENLASILLAAAQGDLSGWENTGFAWKTQHAVSVVIASEGYPDSPRKGDGMTFPSAISSDSLLFHAGTRLMPNQTVVTDGGRVLNAVGLGDTLEEACNKAYGVANSVAFNGAWYRRDIGAVETPMVV